MKNIWDIHQQMGFHKQTKTTKFDVYEGVFATGYFDAIFDYDAGILSLKITSNLVSAKENLWAPFMSVSTIDDGVWQAWHPNSMPLEQSNVVVNNIFNSWPRSWKTKLPTEKELNDFLIPFGLWGQYTG